MKKPTISQVSCERQKKCLPLSDGCVKPNTDGAVAKLGSKGAVAAVFRDHMRKFLGASSRTFYCLQDPATIGAFACAEAMKDLDEQCICVTSDCSEVVEGILKGLTGAHGTIIREIQKRCIGSDLVKFTHEFRESNLKLML